MEKSSGMLLYRGWRYHVCKNYIFNWISIIDKCIHSKYFKTWMGKLHTTFRILVCCGWERNETGKREHRKLQPFLWNTSFQEKKKYEAKMDNICVLSTQVFVSFHSFLNVQIILKSHYNWIEKWNKSCPKKKWKSILIEF